MVVFSFDYRQAPIPSLKVRRRRRAISSPYPARCVAKSVRGVVLCCPCPPSPSRHREKGFLEDGAQQSSMHDVLLSTLSIFPMKTFTTLPPPYKTTRRLLLVTTLGSGNVILAGESVSLGLDTFLSPLAGGLGLGTLGVHFILQETLTLSFCFGFVDLCTPASGDGFLTWGWGRMGEGG